MSRPVRPSHSSHSQTFRSWPTYMGSLRRYHCTRRSNRYPLRSPANASSLTRDMNPACAPPASTTELVGISELRCRREHERRRSSVDSLVGVRGPIAKKGGDALLTRCSRYGEHARMRERGRIEESSYLC